MTLQLTKAALLLIAVKGVTAGCPMIGGAAESEGTLPNGHPKVGSLRRRSLGQDDATQTRMRALLEKSRRSLLVDSCFSQGVFDEIVVEVQAIANTYTDLRDQGHFFGGIVRLAAHDFMDYDQTLGDWGMDGCIDWTAPDNAGLETIWCDDATDCPLKEIYTTKFAAVVGRADFWVAAANAVIQITSKPFTDDFGTDHAELVLPFRWGRTDNDSCANSAVRLPGAQHCDEVEKTFINQMGMTWRQGAALLGAHTLGFGSAGFSGHQGMWMDALEDTIVFDKTYFVEILLRSWRLRNQNQDNQDWTWAGSNQGNPRFMLNADLCLAFDIDAVPDCCTNVRPQNDPNATDTRAFCFPPGEDPALFDTVVMCNSSDVKRPLARAAVEEFAVSVRNRDVDANGPFYDAFSEAWKVATELGYGQDENGNDVLQTLPLVCGPTSAPSASPSAAPFTSPSASPSATPSASPSASPSATPSATPSAAPSASPSASTASPTASPTAFPTDAPSTRPSSLEGCTDVSSFVPNPANGRERDCQWVVDNNRCNSFGQQHCPVKCGMCNCIAKGDSGCVDDSDCCIVNHFCNKKGVCREPVVL